MSIAFTASAFQVLPSSLGSDRNDRILEARQRFEHVAAAVALSRTKSPNARQGRRSTAMPNPIDDIPLSANPSFCISVASEPSSHSDVSSPPRDVSPTRSGAGGGPSPQYLSVGSRFLTAPGAGGPSRSPVLPPRSPSHGSISPFREGSTGMGQTPTATGSGNGFRIQEVTELQHQHEGRIIERFGKNTEFAAVPSGCLHAAITELANTTMEGRLAAVQALNRLPVGEREWRRSFVAPRTVVVSRSGTLYLCDEVGDLVLQAVPIAADVAAIKGVLGLQTRFLTPEVLLQLRTQEARKLRAGFGFAPLPPGEYDRLIRDKEEIDRRNTITLSAPPRMPAVSGGASGAVTASASLVGGRHSGTRSHSGDAGSSGDGGHSPNSHSFLGGVSPLRIETPQGASIAPVTVTFVSSLDVDPRAVALVIMQADDDPEPSMTRSHRGYSVLSNSSSPNLSMAGGSPRNRTRSRFGSMSPVRLQEKRLAKCEVIQLVFSTASEAKMFAAAVRAHINPSHHAEWRSMIDNTRKAPTDDALKLPSRLHRSMAGSDAEAPSSPGTGTASDAMHSSPRGGGGNSSTLSPPGMIPDAPTAQRHASPALSSGAKTLSNPKTAIPLLEGLEAPGAKQATDGVDNADADDGVALNFLAGSAAVTSTGAPAGAQSEERGTVEDLEQNISAITQPTHGGATGEEGHGNERPAAAHWMLSSAASDSASATAVPLASSSLSQPRGVSIELEIGDDVDAYRIAELEFSEMLAEMKRSAVRNGGGGMTVLSPSLQPLAEASVSVNHHNKKSAGSLSTADAVVLSPFFTLGPFYEDRDAFMRREKRRIEDEGKRRKKEMVAASKALEQQQQQQRAKKSVATDAGAGAGAPPSFDWETYQPPSRCAPHRPYSAASTAVPTTCKEDAWEAAQLLHQSRLEAERVRLQHIHAATRSSSSPGRAAPPPETPTPNPTFQNQRPQPKKGGDHEKPASSSVVTPTPPVPSAVSILTCPQEAAMDDDAAAVVGRVAINRAGADVLHIQRQARCGPEEGQWLAITSGVVRAPVYGGSTAVPPPLQQPPAPTTASSSGSKKKAPVVQHDKVNFTQHDEARAQAWLQRERLAPQEAAYLDAFEEDARLKVPYPHFGPKYSLWDHHQHRYTVLESELEKVSYERNVRPSHDAAMEQLLGDTVDGRRWANDQARAADVSERIERLRAARRMKNAPPPLANAPDASETGTDGLPPSVDGRSTTTTEQQHTAAPPPPPQPEELDEFIRDEDDALLGESNVPEILVRGIGRTETSKHGGGQSTTPSANARSSTEVALSQEPSVSSSPRTKEKTGPVGNQDHRPSKASPQPPVVEDWVSIMGFRNNLTAKDFPAEEDDRATDTGRHHAAGVPLAVSVPAAANVSPLAGGTPAHLRGKEESMFRVSVTPAGRLYGHPADVDRFISAQHQSPSWERHVSQRPDHAAAANTVAHIRSLVESLNSSNPFDHIRSRSAIFPTS